MNTTRTYDVRVLAASFGSNTTRAAVLYITNDLPALTAELEPLVDAGLRTRVLTTGRDRVVIGRARILSFLPLHLASEDWSTYEPADAYGALRTRYGWQPDNIEAVTYWTNLSAGQQVMAWDPEWDRNELLWNALRDTSLPTGW